MQENSPRAPMIQIQQLSFLYKDMPLWIDLNLTLKAGLVTCLLGPSGVGKTTLLRLIAGLITLPSTTPSITADGNPILPSDVAYLAQTDLLLPWLSALDNVLIGTRLRGMPSDTMTKQAKSLFRRMGLSHALHQYPHELSGGMRQRVALARTLLEEKSIVLMDEPFSAVDCITRFELQTLATELLRGRTVLLVTHDPYEALRIADEIYVLAGNPAQLQKAASLTTKTPRALTDVELIQYQAILFALLTEAKHNS